MRSSVALLIWASLFVAAPTAASPPDVSASLQNILANTHQSDAYQYPTDLTRGIVPVGAVVAYYTMTKNKLTGTAYCRSLFIPTSSHPLFEPL